MRVKLKKIKQKIWLMMKMKAKKNQQKCRGKKFKNKKIKTEIKKKNIWEIIIEKLIWKDKKNFYKW